MAQAIGIDLKLITADEAYHDKDGSLMAETGVISTTPPLAKVVAPEHTDTATGDVFYHAQCDFPMIHIGVETQAHECKCNAAAGECKFPGQCPRYCFLLVDGGFFITHSSLSMVTAMAAKHINAPYSIIFFETGTIDPKLEEIPMAVADPRFMYGAVSNSGLLEDFATMQNRKTGNRVIGILGSAQVDKFGNLNSTCIGDYNQPKIRFPGSGGACDVA